MVERPSDSSDHPGDDPTRTLHQGPGERQGPSEFVSPTDDAFPGYRILGQLSSGGQGIVYRAIQESTTRCVAVKVLLEGIYASRSAQKRFEREIELVAQLSHPNIISVFDSGTTKDGRRFYVMDYVQGRPLNRHIRRQDLALEEALELFALVCEAVEYAHQE